MENVLLKMINKLANAELDITEKDVK